MTFNRQEVRNQTHAAQQSGRHLSTPSIPQAVQTCPPGPPLPSHQIGFEDTTVQHQYFLGGYPTVQWNFSCRKLISRPLPPVLAQNSHFQIDLHVITQLQTSGFRPRHDLYVFPFPQRFLLPHQTQLCCPSHAKGGKGLLTLLWPLSCQSAEITSHTSSSSNLSFPLWARALLLRGDPWQSSAQIVHLFWITDLYSTASNFAPVARWMLCI